jgi:type IV secretory pathway VirB2 component (pilin)
MTFNRPWRAKDLPRRLLLLITWGLFALPAHAAALQGTGSPWENAVNVLEQSFTGPIARGLSLVAVVVGGLMFAFGEGQSKRTMAGIIFGVGMALAAVNFIAWLFPG